MSQTPCQITRVTPCGRGAVASLILEGRHTNTLLEPLLVFPQTGQSLATSGQFESKAPVFAYFQLANVREEVILVFQHRDRVELHCHGGDAVIHAIETVLLEHGAASRTWQEWLFETPEPFPNGKPLDLIQREALQLLPYAETELTTKLLLAQYHGALSRRIGEIGNLLHSITNGGSFSDRVVREAMDILDSLLASYESGKHLTTPFRVGLIGPVNAGKSSLMNAMLGFNRSITSQVAGTTRDTVSARTVIAGWPVELIDTAGIRETLNPIEQEGILRMEAIAANCDLLLPVIDALTGQPQKFLQTTYTTNTAQIIHVVNKIDLMDQQMESLFSISPDCVPVSSLTGVGLDHLNTAILSKLHKSSNLCKKNIDSSLMELVFTDRQYSGLSAVRSLLKSGQMISALQKMNDLLKK